jgi:hypothetical protein
VLEALKSQLRTVDWLDLLSKAPGFSGYLSLSYLPQDDPRYSRDLLQTLFEFVERYNQLIWDEVTFIVAAFTTQTDSSREDDVA